MIKQKTHMHWIRQTKERGLREQEKQEQSLLHTQKPNKNTKQKLQCNAKKTQKIKSKFKNNNIK